MLVKDVMQIGVFFSRSTAKGSITPKQTDQSQFSYISIQHKKRCALHTAKEPGSIKIVSSLINTNVLSD